MKHEIKVMLVSFIGGVLEYYDFAIFILFAKFLSQNFFVSDSQLVSILATYAAFGIGYIVRPIGGIILAHFGDKYGRKNVFLYSIFVMAWATLLIGFLPTYYTIGIWAPVLLVFLRMLQGLSISGEMPGAITFIHEHMSSKYRTFGGAVIFASIYFGFVMGSGVSYITTYFFNDEQILRFGWRMPFLLGGIIGLIGWYVRFNIQETPIFVQLKAKGLVSKIPFLDVIKKFKTNFVTGLAISLMQGCNTSIFYLILPTY